VNNPNFSESHFLRACRSEPTSAVPIWLMRQAGRYQPKYQELRQKHGFLDLCSIPELIAEVTLIPFHYAPFDASIIFSDICIILRALGIDFSIEEKVGPVIKNPVKTVAEIDSLVAQPCAESLAYVYEGIKLAKKDLKVPLIGFAAAPYTLASYIMASKGSKENSAVRKFMYSEPLAWNKLMSLIVDVSIDHLSLQAAAGVNALQVFDSWVGDLHPDTYKTYILPHMQRLFTALSKLNLPLIHFGTGSSMLLPQMCLPEVSVLGIDWKTPLEYGAKIAGNKAIMGNLDPAALLAPWSELKPMVAGILESGCIAKSHIFNLGHGILPSTPVENVQRLVEFVQGWKESV
jgi:uroporphyrinogen decarboxylase